MSSNLRGHHRAALALACVGTLSVAPLAGASAAGSSSPQDHRDPAATASAPAPADDPEWVTINNGTVMLGVWNSGELNVPAGIEQPGNIGTDVVGLRYMGTGYESTADGCVCEGWGAADATSGVTGSANRDRGIPTSNLRVESFTTTDSTAVSTVVIADGAGEDVLRVTHDYHPSATPQLYAVDVTIQNLSDEPVDPLYRRVMDWDVQPTAFDEWVTIQGTEDAENVLFASNDGFASGDPLSGPSDIGLIGDFVDEGPADHGALFDFGFDDIDPGGALTFTTFYGAAGTEAAADNALAVVNAEVYSYGQPDTETGPTNGDPNTFIFAFAGVGGEPVFPAVSLEDDAYSIGEAAGSVSVGVELSTPATAPVTVDYATADGTATAGEDYTATSGTLTIAPGETTSTLEIPILDDDLVEEDETFTVTLDDVAGGGAVLGVPSTAVVTILDDDEDTGKEVERWAGTNRYGTAAEIAEQWTPGVDLVYVATGLAFPDALTAGALAGHEDAPMLLVKKDDVPSQTVAALDRLEPSRIVVLGGSEAISDDVVTALEEYATADTPDEVSRLAGSNRYHTAAEVTGAFGSDVPVAYIATGADFPDALAGAARAGLEGGPVLLTRSDSIPGATRAALTAANPERIVVLGGSEIVSADVEAELAAYTDGPVTRHDGAHRYDTAALVSADYGSPAPAVFIATGVDFPDALTSGPAAVGLQGPVLLTKPGKLPTRTIEELERLDPERIIVLGGTAAVSAEVEAALAAYLD